MRNATDIYERPRRDLAAEELWQRSLARSQARRVAAASGGRAPRSIISAAIPDLDGPVAIRRDVARSSRDLTDHDMWDLSLACARAKRRSAEKGLLPQARVAGASLAVAAVAALTPLQGSAHSGGSSTAATETDVRLLKRGSRGADVKAVQRALGIPADGIFGKQTLAAVRAFQARNGLVVDGIVGPQTRAALFGGSGSEKKLIRAWWVAPVQRSLGVPVDGIYGPQTRAAVRAYQARNGLVVDGIVGPQTLAKLGITRGGGGGGSDSSAVTASSVSSGGGPASISRSLWDELALAKSIGLALVSGHRPGSTIPGGGRPSDHSYYPSRAIDVGGSRSGMRRFALAVAGRSGIRYVIYSPLGMWSSWTGGWKPVTGGTREAHFSHVHVSGSG